MRKYLQAGGIFILFICGCKDKNIGPDVDFTGYRYRREVYWNGALPAISGVDFISSKRYKLYEYEIDGTDTIYSKYNGREYTFDYDRTSRIITTYLNDSVAIPSVRFKFSEDSLTMFRWDGKDTMFYMPSYYQIR